MNVFQKFSRLVSLVVCFVVFDLCIAAQPGEWIRIKTDDGQVSFEFPRAHFHLFDKSGFQTGSTPVRNVRMLRASFEQTILYFEHYKAAADDLEPLLVTSIRRDTPVKKTKFGNVSAREILTSDDEHRFVSIFFHLKGHVYVVSAASRLGETAAMKRYFESFRIGSDAGNALERSIVISTLNISPFKLIEGDRPHASVPAHPDASKSVKKPVLLVSRARATYVEAARQKGVTGEVILRLEFASDGSIPRVWVLKPLPEGLTRQCLFAALRTKFLPDERDGAPITTTKTLEYGFSIY